MDCQLAIADGNLRFGASSRHLKIYKEVGTGTAALAIWLSIADSRVTANLGSFNDGRRGVRFYRKADFVSRGWWTVHYIAKRHP